MSAIREMEVRGSHTVGWTAPSGEERTAILLRPPRTRTDDAELQVESESGIPDRVLCLGPIRRRFRELTVPELELIRRAAQARIGILWVDPRDDQLWWVQTEPSRDIRWRLIYSNHRAVRALETRIGVAVTLLTSREHELLLDRAAECRPRGSSSKHSDETLTGRERSLPALQILRTRSDPMIPSNGTILPKSYAVDFDEAREAFAQWLRSGGTADIVRLRANGELVGYSVSSIFRVLSRSDELLTPDEWSLVREWLRRNEAWEWSSTRGGRKIPPLTFRLAIRTIRESDGPS